MEVFSVNTHRAYLNMDVIISNNTSESIVVKDITTSDEWIVNEVKKVRLTAGMHTLVSGDTSMSIFIEDAIKLGGSRIKKAFAFDDNPWIFVITKDRLYAVNTISEEEKVEYSLTPDSIISLGMYQGKPCEYFLFKNKEDYSIYNVETGKLIITFSNHFFSNNHLVIYRQDTIVKVYDYRIDKIIVEFDGQCSVGKKMFFVNERKLYSLNLTTSHINIINKVGILDKDHLLYDNWLVRLKSDYSNKTYELFSLGDGENDIKSTCVVFPYYVEKWKGGTLSDLSLARKELVIFNGEREFLQNFPHILHHIFEISVSNVNFYCENNENKVQLTGIIKISPSMRLTIPFTLIGVEGSKISFNNCVIENKIEKPSISDKDVEDLFVLPNEEKLLGKSISSNIIISTIDNQIIFRNVREKTKRKILGKLFDFSFYVNAFFTSDGKNVVFENQNSEFKIIGFEDLSIDRFSVEGMNVHRKAGFNGYKPDISILDTRQPVWVDPVSLAKVKAEDLSNYFFKSADGKYTASNDFKKIYKNRITDSDISIEEYRAFCREYDFTRNDNEEEKRKKIARRKKLLNTVGKDTLFKYVIDENRELIFSSNNIRDEDKEYRFNRIIERYVDEYINEKDDFTPLFIEPLGYVLYQSDEDTKEKRILIGRSVYYLNYVSFSYDSRYLSFGAKMKRDDFRFFEDGVFVLYDLKEEREIIRLDNGSDLYAVWITMFSRKGDIAFYDSRPKTYLIRKSNNYKEVEEVFGKSLLCFSPSGRYAALSDQNYIDYTHHPEENWGHQPSGNIYIHDIHDIQKCLENFNDFGEGISGVALHHGSVASAAFSCDEKRLMAVGDDGVVVVRNLHFDKDNEYL